MSKQAPLQSRADKLKKALAWMTEALQEQPQKTRQSVVQEAELRFDLTPLECDFLDKHFSGS